MNREELLNIFSDKYNRNSWLELIKPVSHRPTLFSHPKPLELDKNIAKQGFELGSFETSDGMLIGLYEIELSDRLHIERNRVGLRNLLRKYYRQVDGCFAVYISGDKWRFSYISETSAKDEAGNRIDSKTEPKRYTYVLGESETVHTAVSRFDKLLKSEKKLEDIKEAFSVEKVTKVFFNEIAVMFTELTGGERKIRSRVESFKPKIKLPGTTDHQKLQEFAVRMIGRIVFCWFLKKKKSPNGVSLIPDELLSSDAVKKDYYHSVLENLFFETLNTKQEDRKDPAKQNGYKNIPFLNGGLFEPHDEDYYRANLANSLIVPDKWLKDFFEILEQYNFTIDENTSVDVELSVDPEMLGRIFENLLAEINPETRETARKSTGSYYTPRPIVEYMVDESLKQYLHTKTNIGEEKLSALLSYGDEETNLSKAEKEKIIDALDTVKILDPACGSGAFPIGMLQKMLLVLQKIDEKAEGWFNKKLAKIDNAYLRNEIKAKLENENWNYIRKLGLIQDSIYGVDIQTIAVEISKLRCFLTLVVDEDVNDRKKNRGVIALPNLEFKFVAANTLIGLPEQEEQIDLFDTSVYIEKLQKLRNEYFESVGKEKIKIENDFIKTQTELAKTIARDRLNDERAVKLANWNPFKFEASNWFEPEWIFGIKGGFDIVIGNPPYVFTRDTEFEDSFKKYVKTTYLSQISATRVKSKSIQSGKINLFSIFLYRGCNLLSTNGILNYITPNNLLRTTTYDLTRLFLLEKTHITQIVDLGSGVFSEVTASTILIFVTLPSDYKNIKENKIKTIINLIDLEKRLFNINFIEQYSFYSNPSYTFNILIDSKGELINNKININEIKLGDICKDIIEGIVAHKKLIFMNDESKTVPLLEGKSIKPYLVNKPIKYLKWDKNKIHRTRPDYLWELAKKIVLQRISGGLSPLVAAIDSNKYKTFASVNNLVLKTNYEHLYEFILSILNSKLINWFYSNNFSNRSNLTVNISKTFLEKIPIILPSSDFNATISGIVDQILTAKKQNPNADTKALEDKIDIMVYKLYGLTYDEVKIVDPEIEKIISREGYEKFK